MEKINNCNVPTLLETLQQALEPVKHDYSIIKHAIETESATPELINGLIERITAYEPETKGSLLNSILRVATDSNSPYCFAVEVGELPAFQRFRDDEYPNDDDYAILEWLELMIFEIECSIFNVQRVNNLNRLRSNLMSLDLDFRELMKKIESVIVPEKNLSKAERIQYNFNLLADVSDVISTYWEQE